MGPILSRAETSKVVERAGNAYISSACCCVNGFRVTMEDDHTMTLPASAEGKQRCIFGVFDGHSNDTCSIYVAAHLPPLLMSLPDAPEDQTIEQVFIDVDTKYMSEDKGGGTTATVVMLDMASAEKGTATVCNTGDSRVMIIRNGEILFVTKDHKPNDPSERERIERANGMVRMNRVDGELAVSRAFGDSMFKRTSTDPRAMKVICVPEITRVPVCAGDVMVIACDGVFEGNFSNEQVCEFTARQLALSNRAAAWANEAFDIGVAAAAVCDQAVRRGSKDNISCMIVQIGADGASAVRRFGAASYVPGPPPLRNNNNSRVAFDKMARMAHVTVGKALERRYELLKARAALVPGPRVSELDSNAFALQDPLDLETEERYFGEGPPATEANREKWFEDLMSS